MTPGFQATSMDSLPLGQSWTLALCLHTQTHSPMVLWQDTKRIITPVYSLTFQVTKYSPLLFYFALFTSFPFCLPSQLVPVTSEPLWMVTGVSTAVPCVLISYCFVFSYGDGCVSNLSAEDIIGFLSRFWRLKSFHAMTIVKKKKVWMHN